ncbi:cytochrome P450 [Aspergillus ibericus CBS 121593]|uniref:Cytochrome P450 n=1 Tax=Aspergillus ibericus CBS 121593 TaxID=1448316 RepID=A0A395GWE6_9EURO|nr:cytochrome P450 [Aspergillus ibericus CBS 121593]RAK99752.1 cytochrome P450 [Aspergillus ibericus CBS 121593]
MAVAPFLVLWFVVSFVLYQVWLVIYRLCFHPLAKFPGPKLVATTFWWECIQDLFAGQGGEFMNQVEAMHDRYGPIVRVTPDEVHIKDPEWATVLYAGPGHIRDKDPSLAHAAGTADGTFGTVSHDIHRRRRAPVSSYFSKSSVAKHLFDKIWQRSEHMCDVLREHHRRGTVVSGRATFLGWSNDSLRECSFGERLDLLDDPAKAMAFDDVFKAFAAVYPILKQCEWMIPFALQLPIAPFRYIYKPLATLLTVHVEYLSQNSPLGYQGPKDQFGATQVSQRQHTLFHALTASSLPEDEKRPTRMAHEGFEILLAGSDTTARTMGIAAYHVMANAPIKQRLLEELKTVMPDPEDTVELKVLESLPFLNAVIKESLRIGKVTDHRLSLVAPYETLQYKEWTIPAGTRVSMTPTRNSYDEKYFPDPYRFAPERWLQSEDQVAAMNRVFMPFAHGRRGCLGMHFAQAELRAGLACVFRRFDFELVDTIRERDIDHSWAHIAGEPDKRGKGLRFRVTRAY